MGAWWKKLEGRAKADAKPVNPQRVVWEMSPLLPANAIITSDSGSCANWFARDYRVQQGQSASLSGGLASMGAAVPYAIGAKFAHPDRPVIALVGDGAMQMNNMAELITVQKYWKRWADPRWIVCVFNNQDLNEVTWEQRVMEGNPRFDASQDIPDFAYAKFGEMLGLKGIFVDSPDRLASAWQEALSSDRPVVLEVKTDPDVAPLPPHLTLKEARGFMSAMAKGDGGPAASSVRQQNKLSKGFSVTKRIRMDLVPDRLPRECIIAARSLAGTSLAQARRDKTSASVSRKNAERKTSPDNAARRISGVASFNSMKSKTTNAALMAAISIPVAGDIVPMGTYASASVNRRRSIRAAQIRPLRRQSFPAGGRATVTLRAHEARPGR